MSSHSKLFLLSICILLSIVIGSSPADAQLEDLVIATPQDASYMEDLAAREIRRYIYLRMGVLASIAPLSSSEILGDAVIVSRKDRAFISNRNLNLQAQQYSIHTVKQKNHKQLWIIGGDEAGVLYGAYRFAEHLDVRFYLHGDLIPDRRIDKQLPDIDEIGKPLFETRGIQPFHDFPEGPDWWNEDEYKAVFSQLPKLRMNFFGLHTYPENRPNAEPTVWIGLEQDFSEEGDVAYSYPSSYQNTLRGNWGYKAKHTYDYSFGAADLFDADAYGPDVMGALLPSPATPEDCNAVFNRTGRMLRDVFLHARRLGIKTCVGTETPLIIPQKVRERLIQLGKDPESPSVVRELYEGMFKRIMAAYPIDYYWFWTPEGWIWQGVDAEQAFAAKNDLLTAVQAARNVDAPFTLATCGWVLGPESDRSLFDRILPKEMPMSCINREVGKAPVQPAFAKIQERPLWAIPWMEDDPALLNAQLWVGRMRADAADALRYGCSGLLGIHWRTRILGPNVSALASAAWHQDDWGQNPGDWSQEKTEGPSDGRHISWPESEIEGANDDVLYQTGRENVNAYRFPVPDDWYSVTLKFRSAQPNRMFGVTIEGKPFLPKLSLNETAGGVGRALDFTFSSIKVSDGWLDIEFSPMVGVPCISAISVFSNEFSKRINCGGPAHKDYQADWPSSPEKLRHLASIDFYLDWAEHMFGANVAQPAAEIFASIDGSFPCPSQWVEGPGGLTPDSRSWDDVKTEYDFLDRLASLRNQVEGKGNQERFDYWFNNFRFMKSLSETRCLWGAVNKAMEGKFNKDQEASVNNKIIRDEILPLADQMIAKFSEAYKFLLPTISNTGELGTICNLEQHVKDLLINRLKNQLSELAGEKIAWDPSLPKTYEGPARLIVPTARTNADQGETLFIKAIILDSHPPKEAVLHYRKLGRGDYQRTPMIPTRRSVFKAALPMDAGSGSDLEYYIHVQTDSNGDLYFPATAPDLNQTVVVTTK